METIEYKSTEVWPKHVTITLAYYDKPGADVFGFGLSVESLHEEILYEYGGVVDTDNYKQALFVAIDFALGKSVQSGAKNVVLQLPCKETVKEWAGHVPVSSDEQKKIKAQSMNFITELNTVMLEIIDKNNNLRTLEIARVAVEDGDSL